MKKILMLLLLPSLLWAGTVTVKKAEKAPQPAGMVDRVTKRTANCKVYQDSAHFNAGQFEIGTFAVEVHTEPIHYLDSTGTWRNYEFDSTPDTVSGFTVVRTGKFDIAYDTTGRIRYQKKDALLTLSPAFNRTNVDIDFLIHSRGLKANYILKNSSAPSILKWKVTANDTVEEQSGGKGKGNLKKASKVMGQIAEFTARDAAGKAINLTASYKKDSLIVTLDTAGAVYPITVDPTVNDTALGSASARVSNASELNSSFVVARDTLSGYAVAANHWDYPQPGAKNTTTFSVLRSAITFPMQSLVKPSAIDSVRFFMKTDGTAPAVDTCIIYIALGTFTGGTPDTSWMYKFVGQTYGSAHTGPWMDSTHIKFYIADGAEWKSDLLSKAGRDTLKNHMGVDSLRLMLLEHLDVLRLAVPNANASVVMSVAPYLSIYYRTIAPYVSTGADTTGVTAILAGTIDSVGATVRGFKYWRSGSSDTVTISLSAWPGYFDIGSYRATTDTLTATKVYLFKAFATNTGGTSYGAIDSFTATSGATTTIMVDGRAIGGIH